MTGIINVLTVAGATLLSVRLYTSGLHRRYRAFLLFLAFFILQNVVMITLGAGSGAYQKVWVLSEPIEWFFYAWVVLELYSLVLKDYQGLYTAGRWSLIMAVSVALLASGFSLIVPSHYTQHSHVMAYYYVAERAVYFSLAVFLLTILTLLTRYPITLNRNTIVHSVVFSVYFLSNTAIFLVLSTHGYEAIRIATYAIQVVNLAALGTWLAMLNPAGERRQQRLRPTWLPDQEEKLTSQLNSINVALIRITRI
ncbi:MAG: hypothetical protein ABSF64_08465 [Bryobacteraceae bacterium]|jgi:hypothetical protein